MRDDRSALARSVWQFGEPVQSVTYYAPEVRVATDSLGLKGGWMSYFGCRAAPLGAASAATVAAVFYNFRPSMVARALPDAWTYASPAALIEARWSAMDLALRRVLGDVVSSTAVVRAAEIAGAAVESGRFAGRVLASANAELSPPADAPHVALWQHLASLREHRGDGHVMSLVAHGVEPCEALVLQAATGRSPAEGLRMNRGWSEDEWAGAARRLGERGWLDASGAATPAGLEVRDAVERDTDRLAADSLVGLGVEQVVTLVDCLRPLAERVMAAGEVPAFNNMGVPWPPTAG